MQFLQVRYTIVMEQRMKISLGSKIFFAIFLTITITSVLSTYYKYMVIEDYEIFIELDERGRIINTDE